MTKPEHIVEFRNLTKSYPTDGGPRNYILRDSSIRFPRATTIGLLGRNGAGKSTLLRVIAGTQDYDSGELVRRGSISWPIGFAGSFHSDLTGAQNTRFVARIYGADTDALIDYVADFTELGDYLHMPVRSYSSGMKARLAFGVSMGIPFDIYLIDEVTSVGDQRFKEKCADVLKGRLNEAGAFVVTHSLGQIRDLCGAAAVLHDGALTYFDDVSEAIAVHSKNMKLRQKA